MVLILMILLLNISVKAQQIKVQISRQESRDLYRTLNRQISDSTRLEALLKLADYHLLKNGNLGSDLDSARDCIHKANELDAHARPGHFDGYVTLLEARLARKSGNLEQAKSKAVHAVRLLRHAHADFYLALAYIELCRYYAPTDPQQLASIHNMVDTVFLLLERIKS